MAEAEDNTAVNEASGDAADIPSVETTAGTSRSSHSESPDQPAPCCDDGVI